MAKIVINFTPIVKDFSPKLRKKTNFSEKTDKYTTWKRKCYQMVLFLNEVIGPYVFTFLLHKYIRSSYFFELICICSVYNLDNAGKEDEKFDDFPFMLNFFNLSFTPASL